MRQRESRQETENGEKGETRQDVESEKRKSGREGRVKSARR